MSKKIIIEPQSSHYPSSSNVLISFWSSFRIKILCSTFLQIWPQIPTIISSGWFKTRFAKASTFLGKVAEKSTVYL